MLNTKEKGLAPSAGPPPKKLNIFSNKSITDRLEFCNILFKDLSGFIEIREIKEGQVSREFLDSWQDIESYDPPADKHIYVGMFTRKQKKGTRKYCKQTRVLWADYDNMSQVEVEYRIDNAGLPGPSMMINSGHGIHAYWLLDKPAGAEIEPILKAISNKTEADGQAAETARVMRVPGTLNIKDEPVSCEIIEKNNKIYSLEDIADLLGVEVKETPHSNNGAVEGFSGYKGLDIDKINRQCMKSILEGVSEGQRNWALGRLTKYLQIVEGYNKKKTLKILMEWNKLNDPSENNNKLKNDFKAYWKGNYKLLRCKTKDTDYQQNLNEHCNRSECEFKSIFTELKIDNEVKFNNRIFNNYKKISGNDLIIYGILLREPQGLNTTQIKQAIYNHYSKKPCMSRPTIDKAINILKTMGLIEVRERLGRPKFCKIKPQGTFGMGYTLLTNGAIHGAIDGRVTPAQFKVYIILFKYAYGTGEAFPGVLTLADKMGITHQAISNHLKDLENRNYIKREYEYNKKGVEKLVIRFLV
jgi:DNA-binding transcriptional ArsR family regulator